MEYIYIICVEDQREVLHTILGNLSTLEDFVTIEECESAAEAEELMNDIDSHGDFVAVVISDHMMPEKTGVKFLVDLKKDERFSDTRKILLTGQATHMDTIQAINQAGIDFYIEKPWEAQDLTQKVCTLLTKFILDKGLDYNQYTPILDKQTLFDQLKIRP